MNKTCSFLVATMALAVIGVPVAHGRDVMVYGAGNDSCGKWTENRSGSYGIVRDVELAWALGFVTGEADVASNNLRMRVKDVDGAAVAGWLDNYCHAHPLKKLYQATEVLVNKLVEK